MFQNDHQINRCAMVLCALARIPSAWAEDGPTEKARRIRDGREPVSTSEAILIRASWDVWNGSGKVTLAEVLETLDRANADAVATLLVAAKAGPADVERWIAQHTPARRAGTNPPLGGSSRPRAAGARS